MGLIKDRQTTHDFLMKLRSEKENRTMANVSLLVFCTFGALMFIQHAIYFYSLPEIDMSRWIDVHPLAYPLVGLLMFAFFKMAVFLAIRGTRVESTKEQVDDETFHMALDTLEGTIDTLEEKVNNAPDEYAMAERVMKYLNLRTNKPGGL